MILKNFIYLLCSCTAYYNRNCAIIYSVKLILIIDRVAFNVDSQNSPLALSILEMKRNLIMHFLQKRAPVFLGRSRIQPWNCHFSFVPGGVVWKSSPSRCFVFRSNRLRFSHREHQCFPRNLFRSLGPVFSGRRKPLRLRMIIKAIRARQ